MTELSTAILEDFGFIDVGAWFLNGPELNYRLDGQAIVANEERLGCQKALYAFTQRDKVQYIGKTSRTLRKRFVGYRRPGRTQSTNVRCNAKIKEAIAGGAEIRIFVFTPIAHLRYLEFDIDLAAGLEDSLIAEFRPPWNGRERDQVITEEAEREEAEEEAVLLLDPAGHLQKPRLLTPDVIPSGWGWRLWRCEVRLGSSTSTSD